jgi:hypothetical protein
MAAAAAVSSVRPPFRDVLCPQQMRRPGSAATRRAPDFHIVYEIRFGHFKSIGPYPSTLTVAVLFGIAKLAILFDFQKRPLCSPPSPQRHSGSRTCRPKDGGRSMLRVIITRSNSLRPIPSRETVHFRTESIHLQTFLHRFWIGHQSDSRPSRDPCGGSR